MASVVFNGRKKITFSASQSGTSGTVNFTLKVENGSSSNTYISTGPIELWIGSQRITTGYSGYYSSCADSSYNNWYHSVNFATGNSSGTNARKFPAANGTISGTLDVGYGTHEMKMYVDYCYSNQKWTGIASVTLVNPDKTMFIGVNQDSYIEMMSKTQYRLPTWSDSGGQNDLVWHDQWSGSWTRGDIAYTWAFGGVHSNASLDDAWNTHVYIGTTGQGTYYYYPRIYVKYNANGGSSTPSTQTKYIGSKLTLASAISRTHYTFKGWSTSSTATTASYSAGQVIDYEAWNSISAAMSSNSGWTTYTPTHSGNNITLYAVWAGNTYKVSYNANGGSSTPSAQSTTYPNSVSLASAISRANGSTSGYSVTYNANGGSGAPGSQTSGNRTITYSFNKWAAGSTSGTQYAAGASYKPTSNVTMYATWNSSTSSNSSWTCSSTVPTKSGYTFLGWSTSSTATTATYKAGTAYTITSALTLYAVWKLNAPSSVTHSTTPRRDKIGVKTSYTGVSITNITAYYRANSTGDYSSLSLGTSTSGTISNLQPNTNYQIYVKVTNASGSSSSTAAVVKTGAYIPTNPQATLSDIQPTSIKATVSATAETNASNTNYKIYYTKKISQDTSDMAIMSLSDGSLWARVFYHNCKEGSDLFTSLAQIKSVNTATKYSKLGSLSNYKLSSGKYEFLLKYQNQNTSQYNRWKQTNNPCDEFVTTTSAGTGTAAGYEAIHIDWTGNYWGGITRQNSDSSAYSPCYLSGSVGHGNWFYAIGAASSYDQGIPSYSSTWGCVELWVRINDATVTTVDLGTSTTKTITGFQEETEYSMWMSVTNAGGTNYSKITNFTTPVDQAKIRIKTGDAWKLGKTYYKKDGSWVKVKKVYVKVNGAWKVNSNS